MGAPGFNPIQMLSGGGQGQAPPPPDQNQATPPPAGGPTPLDDLIQDHDFQKAPAQQQRDMASQLDPQFAAGSSMAQDYVLTKRAAELGIDPYSFTDQRWGHPVGTMRAIQKVESGGLVRPDAAVSPTGVRGRMQITNGTADDYGMPPGPMRLNPYMQIAGAGRILAGKIQEQGGNFLAGVAHYGNPNQASYVPQFINAFQGGPTWQQSIGATIRRGLAKTEQALDVLADPGASRWEQAQAGLHVVLPAILSADAGLGTAAGIIGPAAETVARHMGMTAAHADLANTVGQAATASLPLAARTMGGIIQAIAPNAARRLTQASEAARTLYTGSFSERATQSFDQLAAGAQPTQANRFVRFLRQPGAEDMLDTLRTAQRDVAAPTTGAARGIPNASTSLILRRAQAGDSTLLHAFAHAMRMGTGFALGHFGLGEGWVGSLLSEVGPALRYIRNGGVTPQTIGPVQKLLTSALTNPLTGPLTKALLKVDPSAPYYGKLSAILLQRLMPAVRALTTPDPQGIPLPPPVVPGSSSMLPGALGGGLSGILGAAAASGLPPGAPAAPTPGAGPPTTLAPAAPPRLERPSGSAPRVLRRAG